MRNPILTQFREDVRRSGDNMSDRADSYLDWLDDARKSDAYCIERGYTREHIAHARRVLIRLGNFQN